MASNENEDYPNDHTIYLGASGCGKGSMIRGNPSIPSPANGGRVIVWDTAKAYPGHYFQDWNGFVRALESAIKSGRGFAIGYTGGNADNLVVEHERFSKLVWEALDGDYRTYIIDEEISDTSASSGKALPYGAKIANQSRKYGGVWHGTSQWPEEVPKTFTKTAGVKYIGRQDPSAAEKMGKLIGLSDFRQLESLKDGEFFRWYRGKYEKGRYEKVNIDRKYLNNGIIKTT